MSIFHKSFIALTAATGLLIGLNGCGGDSNNSTPKESSKTFPGHYMDAYVKGVEYDCGTKSGTTDEEGTFYFESGQDCTFKLGKLTLRYTPWDALSESSTVFEDNVKVAQLLQSLDSDGDASNGIEVPAYTLAEFNSIDPQNVTDEDGSIDVEKVADILKKAHHPITLIDRKEVEKHLKNSLASLIKKQIAEKTFYMVFPNSEGVLYTDTLTINKEANTIKVSSQESTTNDGCMLIYPQNCSTQPIEGNISIIGQDINVTFQNNSAILHIADHNDKSLTLVDDNGTTYRLFTVLEDAQSYITSLSTPTASTKTFTYSGKVYTFDNNSTNPSYYYMGENIVFLINFKEGKATVKLYANGHLHKTYENVALHMNDNNNININDQLGNNAYRDIAAHFDNKAYTSLSGIIDESSDVNGTTYMTYSHFKAFLRK